MKFINMQLIMLASFICFSACTEEKLMEDPSVSTSQLQIVLSSSAVITKSGADTKVLAMEEELLINNCVLYIKDVTADKWFEPQYISNLSPDEADSEHQAYNATTVSGLTNGHQLEVMVIANISESNKDAYLNCKDKTALEEIIEGTEGYAFKSNHLLKYSGVISYEVSADKNMLLIPLDILAARIEFVINVKQTDVEFEETYYEMGTDLNIEDKPYTVADIIRAFEVVGVGAYEMNNWGNLKDAPDAIVAPGKPQDKELHYGDRPIIASGAGNGVKGVYIPNYKAVRVDKYKGKTIVIGEIYVNNIRTQAIAVCPTQEESMYNLSNKPVNKDGNLKKYIFYTYAKGEDINTPLQVSFSGEIYEKNVLKRTPVTADWFALADIGAERVWGTTGEKDIELETGWKGNSDSVKLFFAMKDWKEDSSIEVPVEDSNGHRLGSYNNSFIIKGEKSGKIEFGHLYNVTATITDFTPQSTGTLDVSIQEYNTVEVPGFGFN